jgi:hypothetical protein
MSLAGQMHSSLIAYSHVIKKNCVIRQIIMRYQRDS